MFSERIKDIANKIGQFYLEKNGGDFDKCNEKISKLKITEILWVSNDLIIIKTARPGLLIGKRGENIDQLEKYLGKKIYIIEEACLIENYMYQLPVKEELEDKRYEELAKIEMERINIEDDWMYKAQQDAEDYFDPRNYE